MRKQQVLAKLQAAQAGKSADVDEYGNKLDPAREETIVVKPSELALAEKQAAPVADGCLVIPEVEWWDAFFLPEG